jgi:hypothetical protein
MLYFENLTHADVGVGSILMFLQDPVSQGSAEHGQVSLRKLKEGAAKRGTFKLKECD